MINSSENRDKIVCGLIKGRHKMPDQVSFFVFESDIPQANICDSAYFDAVCTAFLDKFSPSAVSVYVTGFTPALLALIKACSARKIGLTAYNFDRESKNFWKQEVL